LQKKTFQFLFCFWPSNFAFQGDCESLSHAKQNLAAASDTVCPQFYNFLGGKLTTTWNCFQKKAWCFGNLLVFVVEILNNF
jgi:hypothetical protein